MDKKENKKDKKKIFIRAILFLLIVVWVIVVYEFSNQTGSESSGLSRKIASLLFRKEEVIDVAEPVIRKLAHFSEYTVGGILFYSLFSTYDYTKKQRSIISLLLGIWYASFDEIHQLFIPNRNGSIIDVGIDTLGIIFGIMFIRLIFRLYNKKNLEKGKKIESDK